MLNLNTNLFNQLAAIARDMETQDNAATENPIFAVMEKEIIYGMDSSYTDNYEWRHKNYPDWIANEAEALLLEQMEASGEDSVEIGEETFFFEGWERVYYTTRGRVVTTCLTRAGCEEYLNQNKHNLDEPYIFVMSGYRNDEWKMIRRFIQAFGKMFGSED